MRCRGLCLSVGGFVGLASGLGWVFSWVVVSCLCGVFSSAWMVVLRASMVSCLAWMSCWAWCSCCSA